MAELIEYTVSKDSVLKPGIVENVLVLGPRSRNGWAYTEGALKEVTALVEGSQVYVDHPKKGELARSSHDRLGFLSEARLTKEGVRANLHFLESHSIVPALKEDLERGLNSFGLSIVATGEHFRKGKNVYVTTVTAIKECDLVTNPATTINLMEQNMSEDIKVEDEVIVPEGKTETVKLMEQVTLMEQKLEEMTALKEQVTLLEQKLEKVTTFKYLKPTSPSPQVDLKTVNIKEYFQTL